MEKELTVSALIATKDRFDDVHVCINCLMKQVYLPKQIIIVDASDHKGLENISKRLLINSNIELVYIKSEVKSSAIQRNMGIEKNTSDAILIMDDDVVINESYIKDIVALLNEDSTQSIAAVSGKIINTKRFTKFSRFIRTIFILQNDGKGEVRKSWANNNYNKIQSLQTVSWVTTCCTLYRTSALEFEKFDTNFQGYSYMEDVDLSYRISKHYKLYYNPEIKYVHYQKKSSNTKFLEREKQKMFMINLRYLFVKNMPHRFDYIFCHYWSYIGYIFRALFLERSKGFLLGTLDGIIINITGKNPLVRLMKRKNIEN